jgi:hypothetical protein
MNHTRSPLPTPNSYPQNRSRETSRRTLHRRSLQNHGHIEEKEAEIRRIHYRRGLEQAGLEAGTRKQITRAELRRGTHLSGSGFGGGGREGRGARRAECISMGQGLVSSPSMATHHPPRPTSWESPREGGRVENLQISEGREWMAPPRVTCRWTTPQRRCRGRTRGRMTWDRPSLQRTNVQPRRRIWRCRPRIDRWSWSTTGGGRERKMWEVVKVGGGSMGSERLRWLGSVEGKEGGRWWRRQGG